MRWLDGPLTSGALFGGLLCMLRPWFLTAALNVLTMSGGVQSVTGTLEWRGVDGTALVVMNAEASVKNDETGLERTVKTNHEGYVQITFLPEGRYTVTVAATGFGKQSRTAVVELNASRTLEFHLQPAAVSTEVTVTGEAPLIDTSRGEIVNNVDAQTIEDRPLSSRNILSLVEMMPGFQSSGGYSGINNPTLSSGSYVAFNGTGSRSAAFQIDGVNNDDSSEGQNLQNVNVSTIHQFQLLSNADSAEFGRGSAAGRLQAKPGASKKNSAP